MLSKRKIKMVSVIILSIILIMIMGNVAFAANTITVPKPTDIQESELGGVGDTIGKILGIIQWGGIVVAVIIAMYLGIKYITSSPEGKAEIKKTLALYIGGMVLLLSASAIVGFIQTTIGSATVA